MIKADGLAAGKGVTVAKTTGEALEALEAAMGRRATDVRAVSFFVDKISRVWPRFGLGLDLLAGFPGETEAAFAATAAVLTELPLTHVQHRPGLL